MVRKAWCKLGKQCTKDIVKNFSGMITPGSFLETLMKSQLGVPDVQMLEMAVLMYFDSNCETDGGVKPSADEQGREEI